MIKITTVPEKLSVKAEGHAGHGPKGQDIVCAAVSILLYAYAAELLKIGGGTEIIDSGESFEIHPSGNDAEQMMVAYETIMRGLMMLAEEYENNVQIEVR